MNQARLAKAQHLLVGDLNIVGQMSLQLLHILDVRDDAKRFKVEMDTHLDIMLAVFMPEVYKERHKGENELPTEEAFSKSDFLRQMEELRNQMSDMPAGDDGGWR